MVQKVTEGEGDDFDDAKSESISSRDTYIMRRFERIEYYYFVRRVYKAPAIYDFLIRECRECLAPDVGSAHSDPEDAHQFAPLISKNRESGTRMILTALAQIRERAAPEEILKLRRPIETEKVRKTWEYLLQKQIDVIEDSSTVEVQKMSASGLIVTVVEPRCSGLDKGKAVKAAMLINEKIGRLTGAEIVVNENVGDAPDDGPATKRVETFAFNFPNATASGGDALDAMVAMNLNRDKLN